MALYSFGSSIIKGGAVLYIPLIVIIAIAAFLGIFAPVWVPWVLTGIFACGVLLAYTVRAITRSLFGRLEGEGETPTRELSFHGLVAVIAFFASMWISVILR